VNGLTGAFTSYEFRWASLLPPSSPAAANPGSFDILVLVYPGCHGNWPLNERCLTTSRLMLLTVVEIIHVSALSAINLKKN